MRNLKSKILAVSVLSIVAMLLPQQLLAEEIYSSMLVNNSKVSGSNGYKLVKTKMWPQSGCILESGKETLYPGDSVILKIRKSDQCNESGIGYSIYKMDDQKNSHLLGYASHRLGAGKFSLQISRFCEGKECIFTGLNPEQDQSSQNK